MHMRQGLHGVFSLKLELKADCAKDLDKDKATAVEESEFPRAEWSIVRAGYSHSTRGLTVAREVFFFFLVQYTRPDCCPGGFCFWSIEVFFGYRGLFCSADHCARG